MGQVLIFERTFSLMYIRQFIIIIITIFFLLFLYFVSFYVC